MKRGKSEFHTLHGDIDLPNEESTGTEKVLTSSSNSRSPSQSSNSTQATPEAKTGQSYETHQSDILALASKATPQKMVRQREAFLMYRRFSLMRDHLACLEYKYACVSVMD